MLQVNLPSKTYNISIEKGLLQRIDPWLSSVWNKRKVAIFTDSNVDPLYGEAVLHQLKTTGWDVCKCVVPAGESSKSLETASTLYDFLAAQAFTRSDAVIALGGGVIGDLAGFVASTYMRGLAFVQIPTSLLAQVDSSIGGKTAINSPTAKNMIGTFSQPDGVLIDPETLKTLSPRLVNEGIAEIIKSAAISDVDFWRQLASFENSEELLAAIEEIITQSLKIKKNVVEKDELDHGCRLLLNFGHTIGHAIESTAGYGKLTHGEAVAIGMVKVSAAAEKQQLTKKGTTEQLKKMLTKYDLPIAYTPWEADKIYTAITHDKKARGENIQLVLLETLGQAKIHTISLKEMNDYLKGD